MAAWMIGIACIAALGIAWSDFRIRQIHIGWFGLMGLAGIGYQVQAGETGIGQEILFNCLCIGFLVGSIWFLYRMKGEKQVMDKLLGWGDVVMLLVLGIWLPPHGFLLTFTTTSLGLILGVLGMRWAGKIQADYPIPLAGALGLGCLPGLIWISIG